MEGWVEFALERYNYWIFIVLMMIGLYTVFARGNLVKKLVGLNIFQTSVFIYYISIGKIAGGTAPIYMGDELERAANHGGGHGADHGAPEAAGSLHAAPAGHSANDINDTAAASISHGEAGAAALNSKIANTFPDNDVKSALEAMPQSGDGGSLHAAPSGLAHSGDMAKIANDTLSRADKIAPMSSFDIVGDAPGASAALHAGGQTNTMVEALSGGHASVVDIVYTNPLPHVLILTAIVVGVATTAVGLALAVRIREAYCTIEEDELEAADDIAEFGHIPGADRAGASA